MVRKLFTRTVLTTLLATAMLTGGQQAVATEPSAEPTAARVLTYDASGSAEFADTVDAGAEVWNDNVENVELQPAESGQQANIRILADDGWPRAQTTSLGNGTIWMGRQAVLEGHDTLRIAAHELGHILGLPDVKPGPCSSLMSGASAGTSCTNSTPDAQERASVEANFASGLTHVAPPLFAQN